MNELCDPQYIKNLLSRHGFRFSKSMGQNFLTDGSVPEKIVALSAPDGSTGVLEIGPGIGALTSRLCPDAAKVVAVELDRTLAPLLSETLSGFENIEIVFGDILKTDIAALVRERFEGLRPVVCANLPYNITSPVITALIDTGLFEEMTLMVQREVGKRICASAGGGDYGSLTVFVGYYYETEFCLTVPPEAFMPAPKVHSAVIRFKKREKPPQELVPDAFFFRVVRAAFAQRRKILANSLHSVWGEDFSKAELTEIIIEAGFLPTVRGEELNILDFAQIAHKMYSKL